MARSSAASPSDVSVQAKQSSRSTATRTVSSVFIGSSFLGGGYAGEPFDPCGGRAVGRRPLHEPVSGAWQGHALGRCLYGKRRGLFPLGRLDGLLARPAQRVAERQGLTRRNGEIENDCIARAEYEVGSVVITADRDAGKCPQLSLVLVLD